MLQEDEFRNGRWQLLDCRPAWDGNPTWDRFIAFLWDGGIEGRELVIVNYCPSRGQCVVNLPFDWLKDRQFLLRDLMSPARYDRDGNDLRTKGLYLDEVEWAYHVFQMIANAQRRARHHLRIGMVEHGHPVICAIDADAVRKRLENGAQQSCPAAGFVLGHVR